MKRLLSIVFATLALSAFVAMPTWSVSATPENVIEIFNGQWVIISFVIGMLWKYLPILKSWTNAAIPWVSAIAYMVAKIATVGSAEAAGFSIASTLPDLVGITIGGFANAVWARQLYEGFGRALLSRWLTKPR